MDEQRQGPSAADPARATNAAGMRLLRAGVGVCVLLWPATSLAQPDAGGDSFASRPLVLLLAIAAMSILPFLFMMATSFVKISVVLSILKNALGTQNVPPTTVVTGLAAILSVYVMYPTAVRMERAAEPLFAEESQEDLLSRTSVDLLIRAAIEMREPLRAFLKKHAHRADARMFLDLARRSRPADERASVQADDLLVLLPAFIVSELTEAFQIGFLVFLPFLVVDMVVANLLLALGMHMLSPTTVSMPFKLLLFVLVDGWALLARGLVLGYG